MGLEEVEHHCGVFVGHTLQDTYNGIKALQHRGQDTAGVGVRRDDGKIDVVRWLGSVRDFSLESLNAILPKGDFVAREFSDIGIISTHADIGMIVENIIAHLYILRMVSGRSD